MTTVCDVGRGVGLFLSLSTLLGAGAGCIVVEQTNTPPYIADALVEAGFDNYYYECFWDLYAWVDDPDGYQDVWGVSIAFIDLYSGAAVEAFDLAYDGAGQWSNRIYYTWSGYADCNVPQYYGYTFDAWDSQGQWATLSF